MAAADDGHVFEIHGCIGRGGFGEVYHATMSTSGGVRRVVAIKTLRSDVDPNGDAVRRLRDEARLLGAVRHPALVPVVDLVLLDGRVALVTEYVDGQDLADLADQRAIPLRPLIAVVGEVAAALEAVYWSPAPGSETLLQIVHRDVKPANIRVGRHADVKLLDFGIARASLDREAKTQPDVTLGSFAFMAPERFRTERVDPPSDVYALGCTLFTCIVGEHLFAQVGPKAVLKTMFDAARFAAHLEQRLAALPADLPDPVRALLRRMLAPDPAARPSSGEVARACEALDEQLPGPSMKRWCQDHAWPGPTYRKGSIDVGDLQGTAVTTSTADPDAVVTKILSFATPRPMVETVPVVPREVAPPTGPGMTDDEFEALLTAPARRRRWAAALALGALGAIGTAAWLFLPR